MQGSVFKRGDKYYYRFKANVNGKWKKIERAGTINKKETEQLLRKAISEYETGYIAPATLRLRDYLNDWLELYIKENRKINTYNRYKSAVDMYINPVIGNVKIKDLKATHIEKMLFSTKQHVGNTSLQSIFIMLKSALNRAYKQRIIAENPCNFVDTPKRDKFVGEALSVEDIQKLYSEFDTSKYNDYIFLIAIMLDLELGLRRGELAGLEWEDVDFDKKIISVKNNLIYSNGHVYMDSTKTDSSTRELYFSDNIKNILKELKVKQISHRWDYREHYIENEFIHQTTKESRVYNFIFRWENGHYLHPNYYTTRIKKKIRKAGFNDKIRLHDFRHTNASLLLQQGVDFKTIQARLGHSDISTTLNIYSHVNLEMQKDAVSKLENILKKN